MKSNFITKYYDFHIMRLIMGALQKKSSLFLYPFNCRKGRTWNKTFFFLQHKKSHIGVIWKMFQEQPEAAARFNCNFMKNFNFLHGKTFEWVAQKKERREWKGICWIGKENDQVFILIFCISFLYSFNIRIN